MTITESFCHKDTKGLINCIHYAVFSIVPNESS